MNRSIIAAAVATAAALSATQIQAATIYWQGGSAPITNSNYTTDGPAVVDVTNDNLAPGASDLIRFGATGTGTLSTGSASYGTLWVGHNEAVNPSTTNTSTVTVSNGASLSLTTGAAGSANAGIIVGNTRGGILNIDGAGTTVTSNRLVVIGFASNQPTRNGTINVTNGASLIVSDGNINMGDSSTGGQNGIQGHLFVDGTVTVLGGGADLNIGVRKSTSSVTQTSGSIEVADVIEVGFRGNGTDPASANSFFTISGGTTTNGGAFFVGGGASTGAKLNLNGPGGTLNVGGRLLVGANTATTVAVNHAAGTLKVDNNTTDAITGDIRIADAFTSATSDATYNLSGTGVVNSPGGMIVGRQGVGKMVQTGGTVTLGGALTIANIAGAASPIATSGLYKISGGSLTVNNSAGTALNVGVTNVGEFRVVGDDSTIDLNGNFAVTTTGSTLAFELETGDLLSMIDVSGTATFASGSQLVFDGTSVAPTQTVYDLLKASDVIDNGIAFSTPNLTNWGYRIVAAEGGGEILQAYLVPEPGTLGLAAMAGMMFLARRRRA
jgi:hypothetical protein